MKTYNPLLADLVYSTFEDEFGILVDIEKIPRNNPMRMHGGTLYKVFWTKRNETGRYPKNLINTLRKDFLAKLEQTNENTNTHW